VIDDEHALDHDPQHGLEPVALGRDLAMGLLEIAGHAVDRARDLAELVARAVAHARPEVAARDLDQRRVNRAQRADQAAGEHEGQEDGQADGEHSAREQLSAHRGSRRVDPATSAAAHHPRLAVGARGRDVQERASDSLAAPGRRADAAGDALATSGRLAWFARSRARRSADRSATTAVRRDQGHPCARCADARAASAVRFRG
jgi:hypothetical protein